MRQPNIVLIVSDQHNAGVMGNQGDPYIRTPNLDRLSEHSVIFEQCYSASPLCVPSRAAFLTGQLPMKNRVLANQHVLGSDRVTFAHSANIAGYETVLSGRMHFTGEDQHHGYEKRLVGDVTPYYQGYEAMKESCGELFNAFIPGPKGLRKSGSGMSSIYHFDDDVVEATKAFLGERKDERPLLMTVGLSAPHPPYVCDEERFDYYTSILDAPRNDPEVQENLHPALAAYKKFRKMEEVDEELMRKIRGAYYGLVDYLDTNVGKILDAVEDTLDMSNTVVIYMSDHGDQLGHNGFIWKGTFLEESIKVPLMVSWPTAYGATRRVEDPVSLIDLTRTLIDMTGSDELPDMDGTSLIPYLLNQDHMEEDRTVVGQIGNFPRPFTASAMIRKGRYKLIAYHGYESPSLYDLENDPSEKYDLRNEEAYSSIIDALYRELLSQWNGEMMTSIYEDNLKHYKMLERWSATTGYMKRENWQLKDRPNYVLNMKGNNLDGIKV